MTVLKEEIAKRVKGRIAEDEDWWRLCLDTESREFYVEHEWSYLINGIRPDSGTANYDAASWNREGSANIEMAKARLLERAKEVKTKPGLQLATINVSGVITDGIIGRTLKALFKNDGTYKGYDELRLFVNSSGGSVAGGLGFFRIIEHLKAEHGVRVTAVGLDRVESSATYIFLSGWERLAFPGKVKYLFHPMSDLFEMTKAQALFVPKIFQQHGGKDRDVCDQVISNIARMEDDAAAILERVDRFDHAVLRGHLDRDIEFNYEEAVAAGIITSRNMPPCIDGDQYSVGTLP